MPKKKLTGELSPQKRKLREKIRKWAYMDAGKYPKQFSRLFQELYFPNSRKER